MSSHLEISFNTRISCGKILKLSLSLEFHVNIVNVKPLDFNNKEI